MREEKEVKVDVKDREERRKRRIGSLRRAGGQVGLLTPPQR